MCVFMLQMWVKEQDDIRRAKEEAERPPKPPKPKKPRAQRPTKERPPVSAFLFFRLFARGEGGLNANRGRYIGGGIFVPICSRARKKKSLM